MFASAVVFRPMPTARPAADRRARGSCQAIRRDIDVVCSTKAKEQLCPAMKELLDDVVPVPVEGPNAKTKCVHPQRPIKQACADCPRKK
mmetsp:Transcript_18004/g.32057  ORF Transcript_18004/g.32057 Transcript_18004/m.32057 type:complete len:89 (+) Transcript_18004:160-426(+)|eukprot:CAMPEP_0177752632 /NCGR_PEP_ID=MMETSP0491_2-20121128/1022_1 /TAXON_ID=63592 /ORGANISM="Tetraselmis chuii, Strain PLY429" /LENGTH=88 /DNA_ID=CAMNT_0019267847 /DNA_START=154 /DNA_END=420 /DNA_ORIENTATION=+